MKFASSTMHILLAVGMGVVMSACGDNTPMMTGYTWTQVSTDMKTTCASSTACHGKGTSQPFTYDTSLTPGSDMANYMGLMGVMPALITKSAPATSPLIVVAKGGMYMGLTHGTNLSPNMATNWTTWITNGATFP
jgi:hypothetical protein